MADEPIGYTGNADDEETAREAGRAAGDAVCEGIPICGEIGAELGGGIYRAFNTDPSVGSLQPLEILGWSRDRARRAALAQALENVFTQLEAVGIDRAITRKTLEEHGVEIWTMYPPETDANLAISYRDPLLRRGGITFAGIYMTPIPYELAPPSWYKEGPYPPGGVANEGAVELSQWADKLAGIAPHLGAIASQNMLPPGILTRPLQGANASGAAVPIAVGLGLLAFALRRLF